MLQRFVVITYPDKFTYSEAKKTLSKTVKVRSVTENIKSVFLSAANDPFYISGGQWGIDALNLPAAWDRLSGHSYIGLPEQGLAHSQNDMDNFKAHFSWDYIDNDNEVEEPGGTNPLFPWLGESAHGTHTFGIIAAVVNNNVGVAGVCKHCSVAVARQEDPVESLNGFVDLGVQAVNTSSNQNARPVNNASSTVMYGQADIGFVAD